MKIVSNKNEKILRYKQKKNGKILWKLHGSLARRLLKTQDSDCVPSFVNIVHAFKE